MKLFVLNYSLKFENNNCYFQRYFIRFYYEIDIVIIHVVVANFIVLY